MALRSELLLGHGCVMFQLSATVDRLVARYGNVPASPNAYGCFGTEPSASVSLTVVCPICRMSLVSYAALLRSLSATTSESIARGPSPTNTVFSM